MRTAALAGCLIAVTPLLFAAGPVLLADETPAAAPATEPVGLSAECIEELVRQLDHANFAKRQAASAELQMAGKQVIPALERAAAGDSRETTVRSIDLLKGFMETGSEGTQTAAKEALTRLSTCGKPSAAARAQAALAPKPNPQPPANAWPAPGGIQIGGNAQIQLRLQAGGNNAQRVSIKIANGNKEIEAVKGDRKVTINEDAAGKIKMEVTDKDDKGKLNTKKYEAANADELKKKHPDAHKIYEEYAKGLGGNIRIQAIQGGFNLPNGRQLPIQPRIMPFQPPPPAGEDAKKQLEQVKKQTEEIKKQLEQAVREAKRVEQNKEIDENGRAKEETDGGEESAAEPKKD